MTGGDQPPTTNHQPPPTGPPPLSEKAAALAAQLRELPAEDLAALAAGDTPFARAVQAETDRREARRQRDGQQALRQQQRVQLEQQEREAREVDPYRAVELRNQLDAQQAQEQFVQGLAQAYDRVTLDPLVSALPEADRRAVLAAIPPTFDGRSQVVAETLKRLEAQWRADQGAKLRKNPAFRKQVLAEWNGSAAADDGSPELVGAGVAGRGRGTDINAWLHAEAAAPQRARPGDVTSG